MEFFVSNFLGTYESRICVNFGEKVNFLKRTPIQHFHSCFLVFSYHFTIISEQNLECILPTHLLMFSNGVIGKKLRFIFLGIKIACNITFLWIKARIFFNFVDLISSHKSYIPTLMQLMPCPFTGPKMFWAGPNIAVINILCQTKR